MTRHVIIDGNNLFHAMHDCAPLPTIGRETLVKIVERWAKRGEDDVTLIFDGPVPREGLAKQMTSSRITVRFSAPATADDLIAAMIQRARNPETIRVISSDKALRHEAAYRRCLHTDAAGFVAELFPSEAKPKPAPPTSGEKPDKVTPEEAREWLDVFGVDDDDAEPFDGYNAMIE